LIPRSPPASRPIAELGTAEDAGATAHYDDAAYYDLAYRARRRDVDFYVDLGRACGGPVLEYGVGTGRVALALSRAGVDVVGVDRSAPMLAALAEKLSIELPAVRARLRSVRGDMRRLRLRRRFPLVIAPFNAVQHLYDRKDVEQFLGRVRDHLTPQGRFVFDFLMPSPEDLGADARRAYGAPRFRHPQFGVVKYAERFDYDALRQLLLVHMDFTPRDAGHRPFTVPLTHRQFFPQEVEALLHYNGFAEIRFSGDFTENPPDGATESVVVSCRARQVPRTPKKARSRSPAVARRPSRP
jgi:SAM-dependent methyltransferase